LYWGELSKMVHKYENSEAERAISVQPSAFPFTFCTALYIGFTGVVFEIPSFPSLDWGEALYKFPPFVFLRDLIFYTATIFGIYFFMKKSGLRIAFDLHPLHLKKSWTFFSHFFLFIAPSFFMGYRWILSVTRHGTSILVLSSIVMSAFLEELIFRWMVYSNLKRNFGVIQASISSSFLFTILHFGFLLESFNIPRLFGLVEIFVFSLFITYIYETRENIWVVTAVHAAKNFLIILANLRILPEEAILLSSLLYVLFLLAFDTTYKLKMGVLSDEIRTIFYPAFWVMVSFTLVDALSAVHSRTRKPGELWTTFVTLVAMVFLVPRLVLSDKTVKKAWLKHVLMSSVMMGLIAGRGKGLLSFLPTLIILAGYIPKVSWKVDVISFTGISLGLFFLISQYDLTTSKVIAASLFPFVFILRGNYFLLLLLYVAWLFGMNFLNAIPRLDGAEILASVALVLSIGNIIWMVRRYKSKSYPLR